MLTVRPIILNTLKTQHNKKYELMIEIFLGIIQNLKDCLFLAFY